MLHTASSHTFEFVTLKYKTLAAQTHKAWDSKEFYLPGGTDHLPRSVHNHVASSGIGRKNHLTQSFSAKDHLQTG